MLCVPRQQILPTRRVLTGTVRILVDPEDGREGIITRSNLMKYIDDGLCDASVVERDTLDSAHAQGMHCNITAVGEPVLTVPSGVPVYRGVRKALSYAFMELGLGCTCVMPQLCPAADEPQAHTFMRYGCLSGLCPTVQRL